MKLIIGKCTYDVDIEDMTPEAMPKCGRSGKNAWSIVDTQGCKIDSSEPEAILDLGDGGNESMQCVQSFKTGTPGPDAIPKFVHGENKDRQVAQSFKIGAPGPESIPGIGQEENKDIQGAQKFKIGAPGPEAVPELYHNKNKGRTIEEGCKIGTTPPEAVPKFFQVEEYGLPRTKSGKAKSNHVNQKLDCMSPEALPFASGIFDISDSSGSEMNSNSKHHRSWDSIFDFNVEKKSDEGDVPEHLWDEWVLSSDQIPTPEHMIALGCFRKLGLSWWKLSTTRSLYK
jgi:hypothetical protein